MTLWPPLLKVESAWEGGMTPARPFPTCVVGPA